MTILVACAHGAIHLQLNNEVFIKRRRIGGELLPARGRSSCCDETLHPFITTFFYHHKCYNVTVFKAHKILL